MRIVFKPPHPGARTSATARVATDNLIPGVIRFIRTRIARDRARASRSRHPRPDRARETMKKYNSSSNSRAHERPIASTTTNHHPMMIARVRAALIRDVTRLERARIRTCCRAGARPSWTWRWRPCRWRRRRSWRLVELGRRRPWCVYVCRARARAARRRAAEVCPRRTIGVGQPTSHDPSNFRSRGSRARIVHDAENPGRRAKLENGSRYGLIDMYGPSHGNIFSWVVTRR